jgi:hypothetical protein
MEQDVDMASIASMARKAQPEILVVDRTVHGRMKLSNARAKEIQKCNWIIPEEGA